MIPNNQFWFNNKESAPTGPQTFGDIYNRQSWNNLGDFLVSDAIVGISGNYIDISGGTADYDRRLDINYFTALEKYTFKTLVKVQAGSDFGIGIRSKNDLAILNLTTQIDATGKLYIRRHNNSVVVDSGLNTVSFSSNDVLELIMIRNIGDVSFSVKNITTGSSPLQISTSFPSTTYVTLLNNTGVFSYFTFAGAQQIQSLRVTSNEFINAEVAVVGDSKSVGYYANTFQDRYASLLSSTYNPTIVFGGGADKTREILLRIDEIILHEPQKVLLSIGCNDKRIGIADSVFEANLLSIYTQLVSNGIDTYILCPFPETGLDLTVQYNYITSGIFPMNKVITQSWTDFLSTPGGHDLNPIYDWGDNTHLGQAGNAQAAVSIVNSGKL